MQIRSLLVPAAMVGPQIAYLFIIGGLILNATGLFTVGILLFGIAVLFSVATLPVEIQASRKALAMLQETGIITIAEGTRRRPIDADRGGADVRCGGGDRDPDAALLHHPGAAQLIGSGRRATGSR